MAQAGEADIRISNTERDEAVSTLGEHLSTGRLELPEYEERCTRAVAARTRGELEALFTDLPAPHPDLSSATSPTQLVRKAGQLVTNPRGKAELAAKTPGVVALEAIAGLSLIIGMPTALVLTILAGMWWLFIPVGAAVIICGAAADAAKKKPST
ncbi:DUF1707 SHOCT-like domain-containing protein [Actinophytocola sediminis]